MEAVCHKTSFLPLDHHPLSPLTSCSVCFLSRLFSSLVNSSERHSNCCKSLFNFFKVVSFGYTVPVSCLTHHNPQPPPLFTHTNLAILFPWKQSKWSPIPSDGTCARMKLATKTLILTTISLGRFSLLLCVTTVLGGPCKLSIFSVRAASFL